MLLLNVNITFNKYNEIFVKCKLSCMYLRNKYWMIMYTLTKSFHFAAAHRLMEHDWLCYNVHGHNFGVTVTLQCETVTDNKTWFIFDHKLLKPFIKRVEEQYDHAFLTQEWDPIGEFLQSQWHKVVFFPFPPSIENLAQHLAENFASIIILPHGTSLHAVSIQETPTASAQYLSL